jgi:hypothetical protein
MKKRLACVSVAFLGLAGSALAFGPGAAHAVPACQPSIVPNPQTGQPQPGIVGRVDVPLVGSVCI